MCVVDDKWKHFVQDMHVARKHYNKQDEIMIPIAEEAHVHNLLIVLVLNFSDGVYLAHFLM